MAAPEAPTETQADVAPQQAHGFELVRDQYVNEYASRVLTYRHEKTGVHLFPLLLYILLMCKKASRTHLVLWRPS